MPERNPTTLQIRDVRARNLAMRLAQQRGVTMTEAVVQALQEELRRARSAEPLAVRIQKISADLARHAGPNRRVLTKDEIDAMWGHD
ncbi:transcriptional regulator [Rhodoblastus acidophilus]|jgi:antitoxin VapB|uniref:Transcriptional regulator n=1 Tax=Rhodoblastus acidophilus TaxID=1074 RepID=A0A6N8DTB9_RHOAC|nr:type II toxin-antitoxin system VapB family antitoxin [Rhodoblastus acidophilus]MCW2274748.1 antitoxin VapB [Rhodoblastus acidophilus]MTV33066.1 transcriptional regulator [Rhodoblastus acidophilus]